jgi:peptidoglycan/xylan/chitin deacetylase (PgdA/CDA1 family)
MGIAMRTAATESPASPTLPVLTFHALEDSPEVISFPPRVFREGIARLRALGWRTCRLIDVASSLERLPARTLVITFDDGYRTVHELALPVLRDHGMTATIFVTVGTTDGGTFLGRRMLGWTELREMHAAGFEIGAHSVTHPDLTRLPRERVEAELRDSRRRIEDALGVPVDCFAYPHGRFDAQSRELAGRHYACACSDRLGLVHAGSDVHALERVEMYYFRRQRLFDLVATPWLPWYLRARNVPRTVRRMALEAVQ